MPTQWHTENMNRNVIAIVSVVAVVAMCVFIFCMSAQPADDSTEVSMGIVVRIVGIVVPGYDQMPLADQLYWQETLDHIVRKTAHFLEYTALGALMMNAVVQVARAMRVPLRRSFAVLAWTLATAYAASDEIHQIFVPGRTCKLGDVLLDSVGVLLGVLIVSVVVARRVRRRPEQLGE